MSKTINASGLATFSLMDLPSGEQMKLEDQIMERALALWHKKRGRRLTPFHALRQAGQEILSQSGQARKL